MEVSIHTESDLRIPQHIASHPPVSKGHPTISTSITPLRIPSTLPYFSHPVRLRPLPPHPLCSNLLVHLASRFNFLLLSTNFIIITTTTTTTTLYPKYPRGQTPLLPLIPYSVTASSSAGNNAPTEPVITDTFAILPVDLTFSLSVFLPFRCRRCSQPLIQSLPSR